MKSWHEHLDAVVVIHLQHRTDRYEHMLAFQKAYAIPDEKFHFLDAEYVPDFGPLGCTRSHLKAVIQAQENNWQNTLILEDDFNFHQELDEVNRAFEDIFKVDFDVFMMARSFSSNNPEVVNPIVDHLNEQYRLRKCVEVYTASGYIIRPSVIPALRSIYEFGATKLQETRLTHMYINDAVWMNIMPKFKWFATEPPLGYQIDGYSDNAKQHRTINKEY